VYLIILYHFANDEKKEGTNFLKRAKLVEEMGSLPPRIYPFASDPAGNRIAFDYRNGDANPKIVFEDHEMEGEEALKFLANSFTEFLESLHT
jgi:hypothetical protein